MNRNKLLPSWYLHHISDSYYPVGSDCVLYHAYWDGTTIDHSIYGNDGTVQGATFTENGLSFRGDPYSDKVSLPDNSSLYWGTHDVSFAMWVKPIEPDPYANFSLIHMTGADGSIWKMWSIWLESKHDAHTFTTGINPEYDGGSIYQVGPGDALQKPYGVWYFLSFRVDRDVGAYLDYSGINLYGPLGNLDTEHDLKYATARNIGFGDGIWSLRPLLGFIGEVYLFNTFKSELDMLTIYNFTKARYGL